MANLNKPRKGLSQPQLRVLKALCAAGGNLTRKQLAEKAKLHPTQIGCKVAYVKPPEINKRPVHANNLINRKAVEPAPAEKGNAFKITEKGQKLLKDAMKAANG
jgi:hypothetical protein